MTDKHAPGPGSAAGGHLKVDEAQFASFYDARADHGTASPSAS
ncbi:hypothetical protein [Streptomyces sp. NPDC056660]